MHIYTLYIIVCVFVYIPYTNLHIYIYTLCIYICMPGMTGCLELLVLVARCWMLCLLLVVWLDYDGLHGSCVAHDQCCKEIPWRAAIPGCTKSIKDFKSFTVSPSVSRMGFALSRIRHLPAHLTVLSTPSRQNPQKS